MKKNRKIGLVEEEFIYKQGMVERLIEAYAITVKPKAVMESSIPEDGKVIYRVLGQSLESNTAIV